MTIDELKEEAESRGYYLVKKPQGFGRLKHCTCGAYPHRIIGDGEHAMLTPGWSRDAYYIKCYKCGKKGPTARRGEGYYKNGEWYYETLHDTERRARDAWNKMIEEEKDV